MEIHKYEGNEVGKGIDVSKYVLDFEQKKSLLERISENDLRQFLQKRGVFVFGSKEYIIQQMISIFFGLADMKEIFHLVGEDGDEQVRKASD
jgi:hypothetical protein